MSDLDRNQLGELLSAYVDGESDAEEVAFIERILETDADARRLLADMRGTVEAVCGLPRHSAPECLADDIAAQLERSALIGESNEVVPVSAGGSRSPWSTFLSMAAAMVVIATGVLWYTYNPNGDTPEIQMVRSSDPTAEKAESALARQSKKDDSARGEDRDKGALTRGRGGKMVRKATPPKANRTKESLGRGVTDKVGVSAPVTTREKVEPPKLAVAAAPRIDESAWLASATVDQIVSVNGRVSHLMSHRFANEAVRLTIPVRDGPEGESLARRLVSTLRSASAKNAAALAPDAPLSTLVKRGFFLKGRPGANYNKSQAGQQVLVYLSERERDALFDEVERWPGVEERAVLSSGPIKVRGFARSRLALAGMDRDSEKAQLAGTHGLQGDDHREAKGENKPEAHAQADQRVPSSLGLGMLAELAEVLTRSPEWSGPPASPAEAEAAPSETGALATTDLPASKVATETAADEAQLNDRASMLEDLSGVDSDSVSLADARDSDAGLLVNKRLKDVVSPPKAKRRSSAPTAVVEAGPAGERSASAKDLPSDVASVPVSAEPERYITLVFSFVPTKSQAAPETSSSPDSTSPTVKAKKDKPRTGGKPSKNAKPIQK